MTASVGGWAGSDVVLSSILKAKLLDLPHIPGEPLTAADLAGKVTIVSFFASWCPPCNAEINHLAELRAQYGSDLTILSINVFKEYGTFKDRGTRLRRFLSRHKLEYAVVRGNPSVRDAFGSIVRIPTLYVFGHDGRTAFEFIHAWGATRTNATMAELQSAVDTALIAPSG